MACVLRLVFKISTQPCSCLLGGAVMEENYENDKMFIAAAEDIDRADYKKLYS